MRSGIRVRPRSVKVCVCVCAWLSRWQELWDLDMIPNPGKYKTLHDRSSSEVCQWDGFMTGFMSTVNETWPNAKHVFVNNGRGGMGMDALAEVSGAYAPGRRGAGIGTEHGISCAPLSPFWGFWGGGKEGVCGEEDKNRAS